MSQKVNLEKEMKEQKVLANDYRELRGKLVDRLLETDLGRLKPISTSDYTYTLTKQNKC